MPILDLSHPLQPGMPLFPGTPEPVLIPLATVEQEGYGERWLGFASHAGTHMDAPAHLLPGGRHLDDFPLDHFEGPGLALDLKGPLEVPPGFRFLLLRTGWEHRWGSPSYFEGFPVLAEETATRIAGLGLSGVGIDAPSFDPVDSVELPVHRILLRAGLCLIENLRGLEALGDRPFRFSALPLPLPRAEGSPVRATARLD
nr:cyclase family protein [uncultured Holophaga sp.]